MEPTGRRLAALSLGARHEGGAWWDELCARAAHLLPTGPAPMVRWRKHVFAFMAWNASSATDSFRLPDDRVIELGGRLEF